MHTHIIVVGTFEVNCTLLYREPDRVWVCDPGGSAEAIAAYLRAQDLRVAGYLLTHGHIDHIGALFDLLEPHPAPVHLHPADAVWAFTAANAIPPYPTFTTPPATLQTDLTAEFAGLSEGPRLQVIETPGHTPGSVCLWFPDDQVLLSGDTLFADSVGRTDLPGGDGRRLTQSLEALRGLPPELRVIPGHGPETTIARECRVNPFLSRSWEGLR